LILKFLKYFLLEIEVFLLFFTNFTHIQLVKFCVQASLLFDFQFITTSSKAQVMQSGWFVCRSVCLSVCLCAGLLQK